MAISHAQPLLLLLFLLPTLRATSFHYCDKRLDPVKVNGVEISPDPVVSGKAATFKISGSTDEHISGGKVVISVSYFGVHVHTETHDLCDESSCPIEPGSFLLSHSQTLPSITPPGTYTLKMTINDKNGGRLTCISFKFKIKLDSTVYAI
ncbi:unnamed protein product [Eruca vesicaria subsp. sativa]|uniref:MD-2-related lipid-recognition domain-containing protein n=1 Tax=Eruca vesicaria subsp. sativa TaxID=29727 RepID=A0ABC8IZ31_ERUVS|nr:unnamed protein product [Eruca vesicaria subsp. sativa]